MKNRNMKILVSIFVISILCVIPVQASESFKTKNVKIEEGRSESQLLSEVIRESRDIVNGSTRGAILSTSILEISNEGGGDIGILIETLAHVQCEEIMHEAILERFNEATEQWEEIDRWNFTVKQEDKPDEKLTALTTSFTVKKQKTGYYYRARGIHAVWSDGVYEGSSTRTDGILTKK